MTYTGVFKVVFCLMVSVILCLMNYSLHFKYGPSSQSSSSLSTATSTHSRFRIRLHNPSSTIITSKHNFDDNYTSLPTEAANTVEIQTGKLQRPTDGILMNSDLSQGTDTGQQVVIHPPTSGQLPSQAHGQDSSKSLIIGNTSRVDEVHDTLRDSGELNVGNLGQNNMAQKRSEQREMANLQLTHTTGFVLSLRIYEQQTMASGNLMQLQCWAHFLNLAVVKPFTKDSFFSTPLDETKHSTMLTLDKTFDMEDWSKHTMKMGHAPLVDWHHFVQKAPRNVIIVQIKYPTLTHVKEVRSKGQSFPHPLSGEEYKEGCKFKMLSSGRAHDFLQAHSFRVVRKVCFNFLTGDELPLKQFNSDILGDYQSGEVTIIIDEWRGIKENQRVLIKDSICQEEHAYREYLKPSHNLLTDAQVYAKQFLQNSNTLSSSTNNNNINNDAMADKDYLAIIARYEMTGLTRSLNRDNDPHAIIPYCLQLTLQTVEEMQQRTGLTNTFLSIDIGKYGSSSFVQKHYYNHLEDMEAFVSKVYRGKMDVRVWEKTFETVAHTTDAGYIAMLQEVLVVKAKCIIFVGGGSFQRHAFHLYSELHPNAKDQCYKVIEKCTTPYRPIQDK